MNRGSRWGARFGWKTRASLMLLSRCVCTCWWSL